MKNYKMVETKKRTRRKVDDHTGFRNGDLFCFNCGGSFHTQLPEQVKVVRENMINFSKLHRHCKKTWEPPVVDQSLSEADKALWWLNGNGERGTSSIAIFWHISKSADEKVYNLACTHINPNDVHCTAHPLDPDDFRRCYLLLETVPEWKPRFAILMKTVSPVWEKLVQHWDELTVMLVAAIRENRNAPEMYELMKKLGC